MNQEEALSKVERGCKFRHILLTRFSVAIFGSRFRDAAWLHKRFELFERFCLPSVRAQSVQSFEWFVFFDSSLPEDFRSRVSSYAQFPPFHPVFVDGTFDKQFVRETLHKVSADCDYLITSRLDNDDALASDYIHVVQKSFSQQAFEFINITNGYMWDGLSARSIRYPSNAFMSLIERSENIRSVLAFDHSKVAEYGPVHQVDGVPGWLIVVHGDNVGNRIRGTLVTDTDWKQHFPQNEL